MQRRVFCSVPVADIVSKPLAEDAGSFQDIKHAYHSLPASWGPSLKDKIACPRIHQLLLHEEVTIREETWYEAHVELKNHQVLIYEKRCKIIFQDGC